MLNDERFILVYQTKLVTFAKNLILDLQFLYDDLATRWDHASKLVGCASKHDLIKKKVKSSYIFVINETISAHFQIVWTNKCILYSRLIEKHLYNFLRRSIFQIKNQIYSIY